MSKRAVIYARVSTAEQAEEGFSIEGQIETIRAKCKLEGIEIIGEYLELGISGKTMENRPQLQKLLSDAQCNKFDEVWVWKTSRLARKQLDLLQIVDIFKKNEIALKSCSENIDITTIYGKFFTNILGSFAELEREVIVDNVKMGMKQRARKGLWNGGIVLGYKSVLDENNESKTKLKIVEDEAFIVKLIFQLYSEGKGLKAITNYINSQGYKSKKGNLFSVATVKQVITNPIYKGMIRYNVRENWSEKRRKGINKNPIEVEGAHEAIISQELWDKVQVLYDKKSHKPKRVFDGTFPLTGLLKCPVCGSSMVAGRTRKQLKSGDYSYHRYYFCGAWRNKGVAACKSNGINANIIEKQVFNRIKEVLNTGKVLEDIVLKLNERKSNNIKPLEEQLTILNKNISNLEGRKNKIFDLFEEGLIDKQTLSSRLSTLTTETDNYIKHKTEIEVELNSNTSEIIKLSVVKRLMSKFNHLLETVDYEKKKTLLHLIIEKITVTDRKNLKSIVLHFNSKTQKHSLDLTKKEDGSSIEDSSSFNFTIEI